MKRTGITIFLLVFLLTGCVRQESSKTAGEILLYPAKITAAVDGDTVRIQFLGDIPEDCSEKETVRLIGVNTPELNLYKDEEPEYFSEEAYRYTNSYYKEEVLIELDEVTGLRDRYGRLLAYVWLCNTTMLNKNLIEDGYGRYYDAFPFRSEYMCEFLLAETDARQNKRGMWGK